MLSVIDALDKIRMVHNIFMFLWEGRDRSGALSLNSHLGSTVPHCMHLKVLCISMPVPYLITPIGGNGTITRINNNIYPPPPKKNQGENFLAGKLKIK